MWYAIGEKVRVRGWDFPAVVEEARSNFYQCAVTIPGLNREFRAWFVETALERGPQEPALAVGKQVWHVSSGHIISIGDVGRIITHNLTANRYLVEWMDQSRTWHIREELAT